jgi:hypothetical protein
MIPLIECNAEFRKEDQLKLRIDRCGLCRLSIERFTSRPNRATYVVAALQHPARRDDGRRRQKTRRDPACRDDDCKIFKAGLSRQAGIVDS